MPKPSCWTEAYDRKLLARREAKVPLRVIALELGVSMYTIDYRLRKLNAPRRHRFCWTPEDDAQVLAIYSNAGRPQRGAAKALAWKLGKLPANVVYQRIRFLRARAADNFKQHGVSK